MQTLPPLYARSVRPPSAKCTQPLPGAAAYRGPIRTTVGLSYAESWIREWCTQFCDVTFPRVHLDPGETQTFAMTIPVPAGCSRFSGSKRSPAATGSGS